MMFRRSGRLMHNTPQSYKYVTKYSKKTLTSIMKTSTKIYILHNLFVRLHLFCFLKAPLPLAIASFKKKKKNTFQFEQELNSEKETSFNSHLNSHFLHSNCNQNDSFKKQACWPISFMYSNLNN